MIITISKYPWAIFVVIVKSSLVTLEVNSIPARPHAIDVEEESDINSRNLEDKMKFKTKISLNIYFLTYSWWIYPNTIIKKHVVMLKVIICVEAHLYMMLYNEFEKIPNVINKSRREHNRITIKQEFRGEYHLLCVEIFLLIGWKSRTSSGISWSLLMWIVERRTNQLKSIENDNQENLIITTLAN